MQISELAQCTGTSVNALRHYEKLGMITPQRLDSGYRVYTEAMRREVVFIVMSRAVGISLPTIAENLPAFRSGRLATRQLVDMLDGRIAEINQQIAQLTQQRLQVESYIAWHIQSQKNQKKSTPNSPKTSWILKPNRKKNKL